MCRRNSRDNRWPTACVAGSAIILDPGGVLPSTRSSHGASLTCRDLRRDGALVTEFVELSGGRIACDVLGEGPLVLLAHGIGDHRQAYRDVAPRLVAAGYRVVNMDIRGHGESSLDWVSETGRAAISRTDVARDMVEVIKHFGGPAVVVGHSISGGAATIVAATAPESVAGIVEINPFTLVQKFDVPGFFRVRRYRQGMLRLGLAATGSLRWWLRYLDVAYPSKPADYATYMAELAATLREPGRMAEFMKTGKSTPADAQAQLPNVGCPALVIMGTSDPDFVDPTAEGEAVISAMPPGVGQLATMAGGHYLHSEKPEATNELIVSFLETQVPEHRIG
ncbi:alpha/beta hydrolase [Nocardia stercoris]|uniref:Alpha/beta hydrolase n=2 Tax=Nocardia stercoris TaxID=2483361 RepID=A0A3M2KQC5_9NOCA|nr:alpha/beta hydrolase [Nocardia stercoris]